MHTTESLPLCISRAQAMRLWGWTGSQLDMRRHRHWQEGRHYARVGGEIRYHRGEIDAWLTSEFTGTESRSGSGSRASSGQSPSRDRRPRRISAKLNPSANTENAVSGSETTGIPSETRSAASIVPLAR